MREFTTVDETGEIRSFPISPAVPASRMLENMKSSIKRGLPTAKLCKPHGLVMSIAGGGPSLVDTYRRLEGYICAVNGSLKWLLDHNPIEGASYACGIMDAGEHIADQIVAHPDVRYYVASICDPKVFDKLKDCDVRLWHVTPNSMEDPEGAKAILDEAYPEWMAIGGGCTMGLRWIDLGYFLGFRKFRLHGLDSSFRETTHAYPDRADGKEWIEYNGRKTRLNFLCQVYDFSELLDRLWDQDKSIELEVYGDGLLQDEWKSFRAANPEAFKGRPVISPRLYKFRPEQTVTVVCVNANNYQGRGQEYVEKLYCGVKRHLSKFRFVCITDDDGAYRDGIEKRPLIEKSLKGWWHKISLFKPGVFGADERILYFDLDTLITGPLDAMAAYAGDFAMTGQFYNNVEPRFSGAQSGVMAWRGGFGGEIWSQFEARGFPDIPGGDQAFINSLNLRPDIWQDMLPGKVVSYKASNGERIVGSSVVCFHGLPRPHHCDGWVREVWLNDEE